MNPRSTLRLMTAASALVFALPLAASAETLETVTVDNFLRAAVDNEVQNIMPLTGGVNQFFHFRDMVPIDAQNTIRMNRDTLYSAAYIDISEGATITVPELGDRYLSIMPVNQENFTDKIFYGAGTHQLDMETFGTPYLAVAIRTLVDASDPADLAAVRALQDQIVIQAGSSEEYPMPNWDWESFHEVLDAVIELGRHVPNSDDMFGAADRVDPVRHFLGAGMAWGGLPEEDAFYLMVEPELPVGGYKIEVANVPVDAFWSVSVYNAQGYFEPNDLDAYSVNNIMGETNDDGSYTIHFGECEDGRMNCLPITEGWNYTVRLYQPAPEVLDGSWTFPTVRPANS